MQLVISHAVRPTTLSVTAVFVYSALSRRLSCVVTSYPAADMMQGASLTNPNLHPERTLGKTYTLPF
jgi:hypothetical protein